MCDFLLIDKYSLYDHNEAQSSRMESSLLSSFVSYLSFSQDPIPSVATSGGSTGSVGVVSGRGLSTSEGKARTAAIKCVEASASFFSFSFFSFFNIIFRERSNLWVFLQINYS